MKPLFLLIQANFTDFAHRRNFGRNGDPAPSSETVIIRGHTEQDRLEAIEYIENHPDDWFKRSPNDHWAESSILRDDFKMNALLASGIRAQK